MKIHDAAGRRYRAWTVMRLGAWRRVPSSDPAKLFESVYTHADHLVEVEIVRMIQARQKRVWPRSFVLPVAPEPTHWPARFEVRPLVEKLRAPNGYRVTKGYVTEDRMFLSRPEHVGPVTDAKGNVECAHDPLPPGEWFFDVAERPTDKWWKSERGALERVASEYEVLRGLGPAYGDGLFAGWALVDADEVWRLTGESRAGRAPRMITELEEIEIDAKIARLTKRAKKQAALVSSAEQDVRSAARRAKKHRERLGRTEREIRKLEESKVRK